eukprot:3049011-Rhodomonas_salina.5
MTWSAWGMERAQQQHAYSPANMNRPATANGIPAAIDGPVTSPASAAPSPLLHVSFRSSAPTLTFAPWLAHRWTGQDLGI